MPMYMDIHEIRGATAEDIPISARYQAARRRLISRERQYRTLATRRTCVGKKELTSAINTLDHCLMQPRRRVRCDTDWLLA
jgi:hypothetical protein